MIAIIIKSMQMRKTEYTNAEHRRETLLIKELLVRSEIGTFRASIFGEQARQAEEMNLSKGNVLLVEIHITARQASTRNGELSYFNDITMNIIEQLA